MKAAGTDRWRRARAALLLAPLVWSAAGCRTPLQPSARPAERRAAANDCIVVNGEHHAVGAPVVLWDQPGGYNAYSMTARFEEGGPVGLRYRPGRAVVEPGLVERTRRSGWDLAALQEAVDLFVVHYDVAGTSRGCFRVLHDQRQLSVHFLLDVDGTIYQTLDLQEQAWHARQANRRSIGIELAHIGAYPVGSASPLDDWYHQDVDGVRLRVPEILGDAGIRTAGFRGRPARDELVVGPIHGVPYQQYDFTPEQYDSLARLLATLTRVFPRIALVAPRDADGTIRSDALSEAELEAFSGVVGHYHVSADKRDPGPAFDWERLLGEARRHRAERAERAP